MILCVGPNPALDQTVVVSQVNLGEVNRSRQTIIQAGGKAANVARVLTQLGDDALLVGPLGGKSGEHVASLAHDDGIPCRWVDVHHPTRRCLTIVADGGVSTDINEAGRVDDFDWLRVLDAVAECAEQANIVLISGSMPEVGVNSTDVIDGLLRAVAGDADVWVDTSGSALRSLVARSASGEAPVDLVKVNVHEASELLGPTHSMPTNDPVAFAGECARGIHERCRAVAVVTAGADGAVVFDGQTFWHGNVDVDSVQNPTGSGDSFLAGLASAVARGLPLNEALPWAIGCAVSNARQAAAGQICPDTVSELAAATVVQELPL